MISSPALRLLDFYDLRSIPGGGRVCLVFELRELSQSLWLRGYKPLGVAKVLAPSKRPAQPRDLEIALAIYRRHVPDFLPCNIMSLCMELAAFMLMSI